VHSKVLIDDIVFFVSFVTTDVIQKHHSVD